MKHQATVLDLGEGAVQAVCSCGWRSPNVSLFAKPAASALHQRRGTTMA